MGYMGFGLQKWIYTQKPKKGFGKLKSMYGDKLENLPVPDDDFAVNKYGAVARSSILAKLQRETASDRRRRLIVMLISVAFGFVVGLVWIVKSAYFK
ncbi:MAG: hypothetical protein J0L66_09035 [Cytophagales bacterium]|nr:hypothetical protein [Cytophagales bacterium]